jgi:SAM-dependent methyltransferase
MSRMPNLKVLPADICTTDFTWYERIRMELLRRTIAPRSRVLDIGCAQGNTLRQLARQIAHGTGIDISEPDIRAARVMIARRKIQNLTFRRASALDIPYRGGSFDAVLFMGDIFSYASMCGQQTRVLREIKRVLKRGGLTIHECMNWEWEYSQSPKWTFFTRQEKGGYQFHCAARSPDGRETIRNYRVLGGTPLYNWLQQQEWPVSPQGFKTNLTVRDTQPILSRWIAQEGVTRHRNYTAQELRKEYVRAGFRKVRVVPYGQLYDIATAADALDDVWYLMDKLAKAEAEMILRLQQGAGPWLFLVARK